MKLTGIKSVVFVLLLTFLLSFTRGDVADVEVSCVFMESCILPCSFHAKPEVIHWIQEEPQKTPVHSYYHNQDQLVAQGQRFRGRTSLFQDQISRGNASLQLTGVKVQDQGRYQCYTSSETAAEKTFIILKVEAPVSKVDIQQEGNRITCSSEGIYPEPELTWSTNPPSNVTFKKSTTVQQTEQQLYNINSSLIVSDGVTGLDYSCTISTDRSNMTVTLLKSNWSSNAETPLIAGAVLGVVVTMLAFAVFVGLVVYCRRKLNRYTSGQPHKAVKPNQCQLREYMEQDSDEERRASLLDAEGENDT